MKKIISILILLVLGSTLIYTQNEQDALRYSQNYYSGTARFMSMGGAFGALGGDISAASINPAGLGLYRKSEFIITPISYFNTVETNINGSSYKDNMYKFKLSNIGFVGSFNTDVVSQGWVSTSFAVGYNQLNNFDRNIVIEGINTNSSMLDVMTYNVNSGYYGDIEDMALATGLIYNIVDDDTLTEYINDYVGTNYGQFQRKSIYSKGGIGEYFLSFAANYSHKFYIGGSLGIQRLNYEEHSVFLEDDKEDIIPFLGSFTVKDHLITYGRGYNLKLGIIYKPINALRIGASIHSPTFFDISEEYYSELESAIDFGGGLVYDSYETETGNFDYELTTPFKVNTSIAFIIGKFGLVSVDYEYVDYTNARMWESSYAFSDENKNIRTRYTATNNIRTGAEIRAGILSFRGGFAMYGSPYSSQEANKNASYYIYSLGIGMKNQGYYLDFGFQVANSEQKYFLYGVEEVNVKSTTSQLVGTLGFRF